MKTKKIEAPKVGGKTPRGCVIVAHKLSAVAGWWVILAINSKGEYVVWNYAKETGECQSGQYFSEFESLDNAKALSIALEAFQERL